MKTFFALFIALTLGTGGLSSGATYYVSPTGSDANNGTSMATPWQSLAEVNAHIFGPGDSVLFQGGQTFSGSLYFPPGESGTATNPVTINSYGTGTATISPGNSFGIYAYNCAGYVIENLNFIGSGAITNTQDGILFYANLTGNIQFNYINISNVTISGFGGHGIGIGAYNNLTGYTNVQVTNAIVHDNRSDGMVVYAQTRNAHANFYVGHCQFYNNTGISGKSSPTGSGVVFGEVNGGMIERCEAYNNGAQNTSSSGPVGIWCYDSSNIVIQHNESYRNTSGGGDGDGFDLDGGTTNSSIQYNYSHDNKGGGLCMFQYAGAATFSGNTIRYNITQNDGFGMAFWGASTSDLLTSSSIYNNTIYSGVFDAIYFYNMNFNSLSFRNNIITTANGNLLMNCPTNTGVTFQGNNYWSSGGAFSIFWNGSFYGSLSSWQAATGQETNGSSNTGSSVDPMLNSAGGGGSIGNADVLATLSAYRLQAGSPMIDTGLNLNMLFGVQPGSVDYYNTTLFQGAGPDVGANEFFAASAPTIATAPAANPSPATGTISTLSVLGSDSGPNGESGLTYAWSTLSAPAISPPTFDGNNGTNAGKNTVATFAGPGTYSFQVVISNGTNSTTGTVSLTVNQTPVGLTITPFAASVNPAGAVPFSGNVMDQFGNALSSAVNWTVVSGAGTIGNSSGLFQAAASQGNTTVMATGGNFTSTAVVTVANVIDVFNGLVGRWNFEEGSGLTAGDSSPTPNPDNGTLVNGPVWTTPGQIGKGCLQFNPNIFAYVQIPNVAALNPTTGITLSAWINAADWNGNRRILQKSDPDGSNSGNNQYRLLCDSGVLRFDLTGVGTITAALPSTGAWHHIAGTWDGATMKLYVDNAVVASQAASGTLAVTSGPLILGTKKAGSTAASNNFSGLEDDLRVYNRGLSAAEIGTIYNDASAPPWIVNAATAYPATVLLGTNPTLSVLGGDVNGENILSYTWQTTGTPPASVTFSANGTNAAKQTIPAFSQTGSYSFLVTASDPQNRAVTSSVNVMVTNTVNAAISSSATVPVTANGFTATGLTLNFSVAYAPSPGDVLLIVNNTGASPIVGTFTNLPNNGLITVAFNGVSYTFMANYAGGDGNDLTLTYQPTPPPETDTPVMPGWGLLAMTCLLFLVAANPKRHLGFRSENVWRN